ncbi:hypothetical protein thsps21_27560 [Pseudomonas sp. No.21]|uniref:OprD family outer membrane porin n=1 Tax=Pseudomonas tohonis TaxID=2725477 RepID=UPI001F418BD9|nr:OprD family outer membrane porin [Pseudomonas tohonis]GJN45238.1 hypothetical protein TUM20249_12240 [Pseudomonas tohonis]
MNMLEKGLAGLACLTLAGLCQGGTFLEDSKLAVRYSQYYWKESNGGEVGPVRDEWVQATLLGFNSGWYREVLGFDYAYGLADDLRVGRDATSISNLEAGHSVRSPHGIAKPVEAYLRARLAGEPGELQLGLGKKSRRYAQYYDDPFSRVLPPSTLGADVDFRRPGLELRYSRIEGFSARNESGWADDLTNFRGRKIDALHLFALGLELPGVGTLKLEYGESEDYLRVGSAKLERSLALGGARLLDLYATLGAQQDAGRLFDYGGVPGLYDATSSHGARYLDLSARMRWPHHYLGMTWNQVRGDDFDRFFFSQDHGTWNSSAKLFYLFGAEGEAMFKLVAGTDFAALGLPGLRLDGHYAFSDHAAGYDGFSRREFQGVLQYRFAGLLDGLSLAWLHNEFHTKGRADGVTRFTPSRGPAGVITHNAERLYLNYVYSF